jgi:hypothetical protein
VNQDITPILAMIRTGLTYNPPRQTLVRIDFWECEHPPTCLLNGRKDGTTQSADYYWIRMQPVLKKLEPVMSSLIGVSLSEENIVSAGRPEILDALYGLVKAKYPNLPIYQWWTPNTATPNTFEGVFVRADGWVIDAARGSRTACSQNFKHMPGSLRDG